MSNNNCCPAGTAWKQQEVMHLQGVDCAGNLVDVVGKPGELVKTVPDKDTVQKVVICGEVANNATFHQIICATKTSILPTISTISNTTGLPISGLTVEFIYFYPPDIAGQTSLPPVTIYNTNGTVWDGSSPAIPVAFSTINSVLAVILGAIGLPVDSQQIDLAASNDLSIVSTWTTALFAIQYPGHPNYPLAILLGQIAPGNEGKTLLTFNVATQAGGPTNVMAEVLAVYSRSPAGLISLINVVDVLGQPVDLTGATLAFSCKPAGLRL